MNPRTNLDPTATRSTYAIQYGSMPVEDAIQAAIHCQCRAGAMDTPETEQYALDAFRAAYRLKPKQAETLWQQHTAAFRATA